MNPLMESGAALEARGLSFAHGSVLSSYPEDDFTAQVLALTGSAGVHELDEILHPVISGGVDELRSEYIELFDRQQGHIPLYETEYGPGRSLAKGHELADLAGFYRAFGVDLGGLNASGSVIGGVNPPADAIASLNASGSVIGGVNPSGLAELPDHVAVELEFYGYLLLKQAYLRSVGDVEGGEIVADARRKFLTDHLGRFLPTIVEQLGGGHSRTYQEIFRWCCELVRAECQRMQVDPGAPRARQGDRESEEVSCGALPVIR